MVDAMGPDPNPAGALGRPRSARQETPRRPRSLRGPVVEGPQVPGHGEHSRRQLPLSRGRCGLLHALAKPSSKVIATVGRAPPASILRDQPIERRHGCTEAAITSRCLLNRQARCTAVGAPLDGVIGEDQGAHEGPDPICWPAGTPDHGSPRRAPGRPARAQARDQRQVALKMTVDREARGVRGPRLPAQFTTPPASRAISSRAASSSASVQ